MSGAGGDALRTAASLRCPDYVGGHGPDADHLTLAVDAAIPDRVTVQGRGLDRVGRLDTVGRVLAHGLDPEHFLDVGHLRQARLVIEHKADCQRPAGRPVVADGHIGRAGGGERGLHAPGIRFVEERRVEEVDVTLGRGG